MAYTPLISVGYTQTLTQNVAYATPSNATFIQSNTALEASMDNSNWSVLANSTTGTTFVPPFVRCTTAAPIVICKRY